MRECVGDKGREVETKMQVLTKWIEPTKTHQKGGEMKTRGWELDNRVQWALVQGGECGSGCNGGDLCVCRPIFNFLFEHIWKPSMFHN